MDGQGCQCIEYPCTLFTTTCTLFVMSNPQCCRVPISHVVCSLYFFFFTGRSGDAVHFRSVYNQIRDAMRDVICKKQVTEVVEKPLVVAKPSIIESMA